MNRIVFLVDVDNTLLDNDQIQADIRTYLARNTAPLPRSLLGHSRGFVCGTWLSGLSRRASALPRRAPGRHGPVVDVVILGRLPVRQPPVPGRAGCACTIPWMGSNRAPHDGDVVFQPRKVERSGLSEAVGSQVLIYIHKELALDDIAARYPAQHYVLVDDKPRILAAVKEAWGQRVTTVFPRQGQYAHDAKALGSFTIPDVTVDRIGDLLAYSLVTLLAGEQTWAQHYAEGGDESHAKAS